MIPIGLNMETQVEDVIREQAEEGLEDDDEDDDAEEKDNNTVEIKMKVKGMKVVPMNLKATSDVVAARQCDANRKE